MLVYTQNTGNAAALLASLFKTSITPRYFSRPFDLSIIFNDYSSLIFATFKKLLGASITIVFILMVSFFIFVRMILRQRRLSELKNDFINNMTHEFKTPLTNISLAVESMTEQKMLKDEKGEKMIKIVGQESERLRENIERILQISRYEKEKPHLTIDKIDVHQLIQKVIAVFDPHFIENEIQFHSRLSATKNYINVDEMHFFNILFNIIDNAIKYNTSKPVISITTQDSQHGIILTIKDNGIGISLNDQKNIFEKFYRVQQGNLHDVKGYGLGLSYVKLIVESHSGQIKVRSQPGQGSEFEIFIPDNS